MFLALRDLKVARGRFVLVGLVMALIALMATLLTGLASGLVDDGISGLRSLPLTHLAFQPGADGTFSRSTLNTDNLGPWAERDDIDISPIGVSFVNARRDDESTVDLALFGVPEGSFLAARPDAQSALGGEAGLVLSEAFEDEGIEVGDRLTVVGIERELPVVGFTYGGSYGHVELAFTSLETWQELVYGAGADGRFSAIAIRAQDDAALADLDQRADTETITKEAAYQGSPGYAAETMTMDLIRFFLLVISALIAGAFFTVWTVQRTRQIGLLKALGASDGYVTRDALGQLGIVVVAAVGIGTALALGLGAIVPDAVPFSLEPTSVIGSSVLLIVVGLAGSLVAIRRITAVDPIVALGAEH